MCCIVNSYACNSCQPSLEVLFEIVNILNVDPKELIDSKCKFPLDLAIFLRTIGSEVRNNKTNPQMKDNEWLIPYKFPTLVPMSVQLHKSLR